MNGMERILATLAGESTDRRAVCLTLSLYGARLTSCDLRSYYSDPDAYARGQAAVWETFQPDVLFSPFALPLLGAAFGSEVRFFADQAPSLEQPAISSAAEIDSLAVPDIDEHPRLLYFRESVRLMATARGQETPVAAICLSPVDLPAMIMGSEAWLETLLFDTQGVQRILDITIPHFVQYANALLSDGATCIVLPAAFANSMLLPRRTAIEIVVPAMCEACKRLHGPIVLHHGGARMTPCLDLLLDIPNVVAFCIDNRDDLDEARKTIGTTFTLMGNLDGPTLLTRNATDVRKECVSILDNRRDDSRFILASSAADIDYHTPQENIHAVRRAAEEFSSAGGE